ncbi:outer membrane protein assembly factor BamE [Xenorhabdus koppenhoeferi]|uniref:Outer membrane protein assembly factor BamE n=1 Tax=Xenorhabdus koppenhoeferi TaxID=351659 RepID=A0A1I7ESQ3_9GAMM|nr:outer membrane protein assembly factor BamE [Xenorhabdus koppenhoeferi]SFU26941.1 Beta-barrel assembly machine subunit BamE [Xenorhabdus koppenhoeferi]
MRCKLLTAATVSLVMLTAGCSMFERIVYRPYINQGNYLTSAAVSKIQKGMTQQQVAYTLGTPMLTDPFGSQTWYYIFRLQPGHGKVFQESLILTFDNAGILTDIKNEKLLPEKQ